MRRVAQQRHRRERKASGWLGLASASLLALAAACAPAQSPAPSAAAGFPRQLQALGTEPFWSLAIEGDRVLYTTIEDQTGVRARVRRDEADGRLTLSGSLAGEALAVTIIPQGCSDGMSDRLYPYAASLRIGTRDLQGCARIPGTPEPPA